MTLVVAQVADDGIALCADGALRDERVSRTGFMVNTLKLILLHRGLCVGYAGGAEDGIRAIAALPVGREGGFASDQVVESLLSAHRQNGQRTDFIVASLIPTPELTRISGGEATRVHRTFVGSAPAHSAFHEVYVPASGTSREVASALEEAVEALVEDDGVPDVGGLVLGVAVYPAGLEYRPPWGTVASATAELRGPLPAGTYLMPIQKTVEEGGFRQAFAIPREPGIGALGIYFNPGDLGLLLYPTVALYPIVYRDMSQERFSERVLRDHGINLLFDGKLDPEW